jgi:elongation factor P--beta-lysine ligase
LDYIRDKERWSEKDKNGISRKEKLLKRQRILAILREYFREHCFFEADIPLLVSGTTPDAGIQSFRVHDKYLTASTEYHIKRMIAGGFERVFTLTKNFREYEFDAFHNPEFTMLEWGRSQESLETIEQDLSAMVTAIHAALYPDKAYLEYQNAKITLEHKNWREMTFQDLFYRHYGIVIPENYRMNDIFSLVKQSHIEIDPLFQQEPSLLLSDLLDKAIKHIGFDAPVLLKKWPSQMTSSADSGINAQWTTRTEVIIGGIEIADGFPFLLDYDIQRYFFDRANTHRKAVGLPLVQYDEQYLAMLQQGFCPGAGMALGVDRLCMLFTDSTDIRDVLCFAWDEL